MQARMNIQQDFDAVIIGGGACGLMCAAQAGRMGKKVLLLERNDRLGAKILISGGGRCNYTNLHTTPANFVSNDPGFSAPIFEQWSVQDTIDFFESNDIYGQEKTLGQLFPTTNKAKDIVAVFERILRETSQTVLLNALVKEVTKDDSNFVIHTEVQGTEQIFTAKQVVFASGGLPVAKLGASDFAIRTASKFGLPIVPTAPALVPLVITGKNAEWYAALSGNTVFARVSNARISFEEQILFTHWGLSGPAILQISSYWRAGESIFINLLPQQDIAQLIKEERENGGRKLVHQLLKDYFSKRLIDALCQLLPLDTKIASLSKADATLISKNIHKFEVKPASDKGYDKAEVMRGGVATDSLHPDTLMAKDIPGMYFGGEAVDMTGWLGGYNFQWAWASGFVIAKSLQSFAVSKT